MFAIEVGPGDLIRVPRGTWHWFDLCAERRIRAIRLFQDPSGWTPHYTDSGAERGREPVCLGPQWLAGVTRVSARRRLAAYLLDVEGTTTPIDFVYRVLFPYARDRFLRVPGRARSRRRGRGRGARRWARSTGATSPRASGRRAWEDTPGGHHRLRARG